MRALDATFVIPALLALGCADDVGPCVGDDAGRVPVISGGDVMYAGQAIINKSCAGGRCHSSTAEGEARSGAPGGLDFDLVPIDEASAAGTDVNSDDETYVVLKPEQLRGLRERQRRVYDWRDDIWELVKEFRMPPPQRAFASFRSLRTIFDLAPTDEESCARGTAYASLLTAESREVLRNWLACRVPIVESNGAAVEQPETKGEQGWQYPACEASADGPVSLQTLLDGPLATCATCHPSQSRPDFSSRDQVVRTVVESNEEICNGKPYVTKGDPSRSFLLDILSAPQPNCTPPHSQMPLGGTPLDERELALVESWIAAGAPVTDSEASAQSLPDGD